MSFWISYLLIFVGGIMFIAWKPANPLAVFISILWRPHFSRGFVTVERALFIGPNASQSQDTRHASGPGTQLGIWFTATFTHPLQIIMKIQYTESSFSLEEIYMEEAHTILQSSFLAPIPLLSSASHSQNRTILLSLLDFLLSGGGGWWS